MAQAAQGNKQGNRQGNRQGKCIRHFNWMEPTRHTLREGSLHQHHTHHTSAAAHCVIAPWCLTTHPKPAAADTNAYFSNIN
jgi:hypothetical protein